MPSGGDWGLQRSAAVFIEVRCIDTVTDNMSCDVPVVLALCRAARMLSSLSACLSELTAMR